MEPYIINYNSYVRFSETRLIDANNQFYDRIYIKEAKDMAKNSDLDLVCFSEPIDKEMALCKIINFGKWRYQQEKAKRKEHSHRIEVKEIQFTPVIGDNDIQHKVRQIINFLKEGDEVVINMRFKGIHHRLVGEGERIIAQILEAIKDYGKQVYVKKTDDNIVLRLVKL